ncbi:MAG: GNVR domain-containing protein [Candidatus Omnitrophota bacterium]|jgi:uncharacterized protein involved in exopolysaccharide biosynthesis
MEAQSSTQKNPADYLKIIFRRKWFLIIPMLVGLVGGIIAGNVMPKVYEASTLILVEDGKANNPLMQDLTISTSMVQRLGVLREQILGWDRLQQLITTLNLAKDVKNQWQFEMLVKSLRKNIRVDIRKPHTNIISISYGSEDPAEAKNIVKTITDIFIAENLRQQTKETDVAVSFINDQVELFQKKLKESDVADMQDQLNKLLVDSTPKHPLVIELKKKIESAKAELKEGNYSVQASSIAGSDSELKDMREELKQMKEDLANPKAAPADAGANRTAASTTTNEKLYKLLLLEKVDQATAKDQTVNQKLYNTLLERLETAKITQRLAASKEGTRYTILDPVRLPIKPKWPNRPIVLFMGLMFGACVGIAVVCLMELFDHSFLGVDEARAFLDLPIFGAISKIITEADIKAAEIRRVRMTGISVVTGVVLVIVIIFNVFLGS